MRNIRIWLVLGALAACILGAGCGREAPVIAVTPGVYKYDPLLDVDIEAMKRDVPVDVEVPEGAMEALIGLGVVELRLEASGTFELKRGPSDLTRIEEGNWRMESGGLLLNFETSRSEATFNGKRQRLEAVRDRGSIKARIERGIIHLPSRTGGADVVLKRIEGEAPH